MKTSNRKYKVKTVNHRIPPKKALCVINNSKVINQELKPYLSEQEKSSPDSCVKCYTMFLPFLLIKIDVFS